MEILYYNLQGKGKNVSLDMYLKNNTAQDTNYSVFPTIYYGYDGSKGTYDAVETSEAVPHPLIGDRTSSSFKFYLQKSTGDNVNIYLIFLVVYGVYDSGYP